MVEDLSQQKHIGRLIHMISHHMKRLSATSYEDCGLTHTQGHILRYIILKSLCNDVYQKNIEHEFQIRRSSATGILQLLEKKGYIYRESEKTDARLKKIKPTDKAIEIRGKILENIKHTEKVLKKDIDTNEYQIFIKVMEKMIQNLSEEENNT